MSRPKTPPKGMTILTDLVGAGWVLTLQLEGGRCRVIITTQRMTYGEAGAHQRIDASVCRYGETVDETLAAAWTAAQEYPA